MTLSDPQRNFTFLKVNLMMNNNTPQRRVLAYIAALLVFTFIANVLAAKLAGSPMASLLIMWSPALAALVASILTRRSLKDIGWKPWPVKWLAMGWLLPLLYALPAYALVWLTGLGGIPNPTFLERARLTLNMPEGSDGLVIIAAFGFITVVNLIPGMVFSLGEEIGWRGLLVPELTDWVGFRKASIMSGLIWAAWHLPGLLSGDYGAIGTPKWFQLACFTVMVVTTGVAMAWLRMKSGSIWPVAIMHAMHNGLIQTFLDRITLPSTHTSYFTGEFGLAILPLTILLAWYVWLNARNFTHPQLLSAK